MGESTKVWLAELFSASVAGGLSPEDVMRHVTPNVLAEFLPSQVFSQLVSKSLRERTLSPKSVLASLPARVLTEHIPTDLVWTCVKSWAKGRDEMAQLAFLSESIQTGFQIGAIGHDQFLAYLPFEAICDELPTPIKAGLLSGLMSAETVSPKLLVETIGLSKWIQAGSLETAWACLEKALDAGEGEVTVATGNIPVSPAKKRMSRDTTVRAAGSLFDVTDTQGQGDPEITQFEIEEEQSDFGDSDFDEEIEAAVEEAVDELVSDESAANQAFAGWDNEKTTPEI